MKLFYKCVKFENPTSQLIYYISSCFFFFFCEIIITVEKHRDANNKFSLSLSKKMNEYTTTIAKESEILLKEAIFSIFPITSGSLLFRNFFFFFFVSDSPRRTKYE